MSREDVESLVHELTRKQKREIQALSWLSIFPDFFHSVQDPNSIDDAPTFWVDLLFSVKSFHKGTEVCIINTPRVTFSDQTDNEDSSQYLPYFLLFEILKKNCDLWVCGIAQ